MTSTEIPVGRAQNWLAPALLMGAAGGVAMGFGRLSYAFVLDDMVRAYLGSYSVAGLIGTANLTGYVISALLSGLLLRRWSPEGLSVRGLAVSTACLFVFPLTSTPMVAGLVMLLLGGAGGLVWISSVPIVSKTVPANRRGVAYGIALSGVGASAVLTGVVVRVCHGLLGDAGWRATWIVEGCGGLLVLILVIAFLAHGGTPGPAQQGSRTLIERPPAGITAALILYLCYGLMHGIFSNYYVVAAQEGGTLSHGTATTAFSILGLTNLFGGMVLGRLSDSWGRRPLLLPGLILLAGCCAAVTLHSAGLTLASSAMYGLLMGGVPAIITAALADQLAPADLARGYAAISLAVGLGQLLSPPIGGWLADRTGAFTVSFLLATAFAVIGAGAAFGASGLSRRAGRHRR
ncbi:MFS transporter [Dactylosporangium sp. NPDC005572]|uniref:MFS transporter n=1 Tax=Dactylosporangium sp. NPDC005572 TaxID=3156889 RepID=UPI0033AEBD1F